MNLLLLLSALLSALTGAGVGVRTPPAAVTVSRTAETVAVAPAKAARAVGVPIAALPSLVSVAAVRVAPAWRLSAIEPLYLSRRRE